MSERDFQEVETDDDVQIVDAGRELVKPDEAGQMAVYNISSRAIEPMAGLVLHPQGIKMLAKMAAATKELKKTAIAFTQPEDWVLNKNDEGQITAFPAAQACYAIGQIFLVQILNPSPVEIETLYRSCQAASRSLRPM